MGEPIFTIIELGRSRHQELEAEVGRCYSKAEGNRPTASKQRLAWALSSAVFAALVIARLLVR